jgi:tetratricopeptide (TPR) repeat protein
MMIRRNILLVMLIAVSISSYAQKGKNQKQEVVIVSGQVLDSKDSAQVNEYYYTGLREKVIQNQTLAIDYFNQVLKLDPAHHFSYYELAQIYYKQGALKEAKEFAQKATTIKTDNEWYWLLLANIYGDLQDYQLLIYALDELIKISPDKLDYGFEKAEALFMLGKDDAALLQYQHLEKQTGLSDEILRGRQKIYIKNGEIDKAVADLTLLIKNNPAEERYYFFLGDLYFSNNKIFDALAVYQQALFINDNNPMTRLAIAQIYDTQKKPEDAFQQLRLAFVNADLNIDTKVKIIIKYFDEFPEAKALFYAETLAKILTEVHPDQPKSFALYGDVLFQQNNFIAAKAAYESALMLNKNVYEVWDQLIRVQISLNDFTGVVKNGEEALALYPNHYSLYFYISIGYSQQKQFEKAISYLQQTLIFDIESNEFKSQIYSSLGDAYQEQKNYKASEAAYDDALRLMPNNTYTLNNYAYYLSLRNEQLEKAEKMSAKSNQIEKDNASFQDTYAWILFKQAKFSEAKVWMEKAMKNNENSAVQYDHFGDILLQLGEKENAIIQWKKALNLSPNLLDIQTKINHNK